MGMFSWKCAVSGESIANVHSGKPKRYSQCYLVTPEKTFFEPAYDGYGVFGGVDVYELLGDGNRNKGINDNCNGVENFKIKLVLKDFYNGQKYDDLKESEDCEHQGFFY